MLLFLQSCSSQMNVNPQKINSLLQSGEFTFVAERAIPTNSDVVNILNSLPNSSASRMLDLDPGYTVEIKKSEIAVALPYFGRMYTPNFDQDKNSYRFTTKDFTMSESSGKKGSNIYNISTKDQQNSIKMILQVYKNGQAYLSVNSNDRQSISYDGYIMENILPKK